MPDLNPDRLLNDSVSDRYRNGDFENFGEIDETILDHGFRLFDLHAKQRMDGFRSYLIASAVLFAAFAAMWREQASLACAMISGAYIVINLAFYTLDVRVLQLIKYAEQMLAVSQARLAGKSQWNDADKSKIEFFNQSDDEQYLVRVRSVRFGKITYRDVFYKIFGLMTILAVIAFVASCILMSNIGRATSELDTSSTAGQKSHAGCSSENGVGQREEQ